MSQTTTIPETTDQANLPAPGVYAVDLAHSSVGFVVRHLVASKVRGQFTAFEGQITVGETPQASSVTASVRADSITTNNEMRDGHLKSPDFLDFENHPTLELRSTSVTATGPATYELATELTLRGVTRPVLFELEYLGTNPGLAPNTTVAGFEARAEIDRREFGVNFDATLENGAIVVGNKIVLELNIEAVKQN